MTQRFALFLSAAVTAFLLVVVGAAVALGGRAQTAGDPTLDPQLVAELQAREATYQAMIAEANAKLQAAEPTPLTTVTPVPEPTAVDYPISPELAAYLALSTSPNAYLVKPPELVMYSGRVAYEVTLSTGVVYIDAHSGAILWNGAARRENGNGPGFSGEDDDEWDDD